LKNVLVCHTETEESPVTRCEKPFPVSQEANEESVFQQPIGREYAASCSASEAQESHSSQIWIVPIKQNTSFPTFDSLVRSSES